MRTMPSTITAIVFAVIAACALYGLRQDLATGVARDRFYRCDRETNPFGYHAIITGKLLVLAFCVAVVLHAMNLGPDPVALLRPVFG